MIKTVLELRSELDEINYDLPILDRMILKNEEDKEYLDWMLKRKAELIRILETKKFLPVGTEQEL